jgi:hypothetical protein
MAQYKTLASVTNGSQQVVISGQNAAFQIKARSIFMVASELVPYFVATDATFDGTNTIVTLTGAYQGATPLINPIPCVFSRDFTYPDNIPTIAQGDVGTAAIFTCAMNRIQDMIHSVSTSGLGQYVDMYNAVVAAANVVSANTATVISDAAIVASDKASAASSAESAATSATSATASQNKAAQWADADLNIQVEDGKYSAKHWATIAKATVTGILVYRGSWDASSGVYPSAPTLGDYYKISVAGAMGGIQFAIGDSMIFNGTDWDKIDSSDQVTSVAGRQGAVVLTKSDVGLSDVDNVSDINKPISAAQQTALNTKQDTSGKDASNGYAGLTLFKLNLRNVANTVTSWFTNSNTTARTYTLPDKDGTVAMTSDLTSASISNTPFGNIAATTVQNAINELDAEKAKLAGDGSQTFAVANATSSNQAVNLGQLSNASINTNFSGLTVTQNITSLPANYDVVQVKLLQATTSKAGVSFTSSDSRILTAGLGPNGPFIRSATNPLDLTNNAGVLVPNAAASNQAVNLGQLTASAGSSLVGFTQSGAGAVTRTLQAKSRENVSVKDFGAVGNGVTDDTAAIQAAIDYVASLGGGIVDCAGGRWLIDSADVVVKNGVTLHGPWNNLGEADNIDYSSIKSAFVLNPVFTIRLAQEFSAIKGMGIFRKGLFAPASIADATTLVNSFAGKAITVGYGNSKDASDTYAGYCLILGFQYAYWNDYNERPRIEYITGDCTNGIYLNRIYDVNQLFGCHFWPFTTAHQSWTFSGDAGWRRQGTAYYFGLGVDWGQAVNCFSYGYDNGFWITGSDNVELLNCGADGHKNDNTYSVGYRIESTTKNASLIGCKAASKNTSVLINISGGGDSQCVKITGGNLWSCSAGTGSHVYVQSGDAIITGGVAMFDGPVGVKTGAAAGNVTIVGNIFQLISMPYSLVNTNISIVHSNSFYNCADASVGAQLNFSNTYEAISHSIFGTSGINGGLFSRQAAGSAAAPLASPNGGQAGRIIAQFHDGTTFGTAGHTRFTLRAAPSAGSTPGGYIIATTPAGSSVPVDRVAVNESGDFYPATDNAYLCGTPSNRWSAIYAANGTVQTSDARTKTDITDASLGLEFINSLRPVSYKWIEGGKKIIRQVFRDINGNECDFNAKEAIPAEIITELSPGKRTHWGLIAQEVKAVVDAAGVDFGGWVLLDTNDPDSQQALRYDQFIAPLIKAIQELTARVKKLESSNETAG